MDDREENSQLSVPLRNHSYSRVVEGALIAFRPQDQRGSEILDALEDLADITLRQVLEDGTRRYRLIRRDADIKILDSELDRIDPNWGSHIRVYREPE